MQKLSMATKGHTGPVNEAYSRRPRQGSEVRNTRFKTRTNFCNLPKNILDSVLTHFSVIGFVMLLLLEVMRPQTKVQERNAAIMKW